MWGREELPHKTRSMLNLAMISILNRPHELKAHIKGALTNGVSRDEIREIFMQVSIYAGIPAGVDSFRIAREVFAELDKAESGRSKKFLSVIASEAKQSTSPRRERAGLLRLLAMTNSRRHHGNRIYRPRQDGFSDGATVD